MTNDTIVYYTMFRGLFSLDTLSDWLYNPTRLGDMGKLRMDLTDYRIYIQTLQDKLNDEGLYSMSMTDAVKIAIERAVEKLLPDIEIKKTRKKYVRLEF